MELLMPGIDLILWSCLSLLLVGWMVYAVIHLYKTIFIAPDQKWLWLIVISSVPLVGCILYFDIVKTRKTKNSVAP